MSNYTLPDINVGNYNLKAILKELNCWCLGWKGNINSVYSSALTLEEQVEKLFAVVKATLESQENITEGFALLYDFVDEFYKNLDLQTEVNNKLSEMAENGELTKALLINNNYNAIQKIPTSLKVVCAGDSLTAGVDPSTGAQFPITNQYPYILQQYLSKFTNAVVVNKGVNGVTTQHPLDNYASLVTAESPDIVIYEYGTNDLRLNKDFNTILNNIETFVLRCKSDNVYCAVMPIITYYATNTTRFSESWLLNKEIKRVCESLNVPFLDSQAYLKNLYEGNTYYIYTLQPDGVHIKDYNILASCVISGLFNNYIYNVDNSVFSGVSVTRQPGLITTAATNESPSVRYRRNLVLKNDSRFEFNFEIKSKTFMQLVVASNSQSGVGKFNLSGMGEFNTNFEFNAFSEGLELEEKRSLPIGPLKPGRYTLSLNGVTKGDSTYDVFSFYLEALEFSCNSENAITVEPNYVVINNGETQRFFTNINNPIWSLSNVTGGIASSTTISSTGVLSTGLKQSSATIKVMASDSINSAVANVTIVYTNPEVRPSGLTLAQPATQQFALYHNDKIIDGATWAVLPGSIGVASTTTIDGNGLLTVSSNQSSGTLKIQATYDSVVSETIVTIKRA
jgi:lysophospholipase L1-like esterase